MIVIVNSRVGNNLQYLRLYYMTLNICVTTLATQILHNHVFTNTRILYYTKRHVYV